eukprot:3779111-Lingulodinium_polyedra.AAC.1
MTLLAEPRVRGGNASITQRARSLDGEEVEGPGAAVSWAGGAGEASLQPAPLRHLLGNVRGKCLPLAANSPAQRAI